MTALTDAVRNLAATLDEKRQEAAELPRCRWCAGPLGLAPFSRDYCSRTCAEERYGREP